MLCTGGHSTHDANDLLWIEDAPLWFYATCLQTTNTYRTGCILSTAIASNLPMGFDLAASVTRSKDYLSSALADLLDLGHGSGPLNHGFDIKDIYRKVMNT